MRNICNIMEIINHQAIRFFLIGPVKSTLISYYKLKNILGQSIKWRASGYIYGIRPDGASGVPYYT